MQGWGDNKGGSENNIHYPAGGRTELALSPRRRSWTGMTAKRGRRREKGPGEEEEEKASQPGNEEKRWDRRESESEWNKIKGEWGLFSFVFLGLSGGLALYILDVKHMGGQRRREVDLIA